MTLLLVIDVQSYFINDKTSFLVNKIKSLIESNKYDNVLFTRFVNKENSPYIKKLSWKFCLNNEDNIIPFDGEIINKSTYSAYNDELIKYIKDNSITKIYLCGIDTEACVLKTALDLFEKGIDVYVLKDYCASTGGLHNEAINILSRTIGKNSIL